jgi:hypothetical protein
MSSRAAKKYYEQAYRKYIKEEESFEMDLEGVVKDLGFESESEFHRMVSSVDLSTPVKRTAFKDWQHNDGTKKGLMKLVTGKDE